MPETQPTLAPTGADIGSAALRVEFDTERTIRTRNKLHYRFNHWPIWIFVFFIAPGPLTFDLFERGFDRRMGAWLAVVLLGTGIAAVRGRLPGVEARPYIIRFTEDRSNPLLRVSAWPSTRRYETAPMADTAELIKLRLCRELLEAAVEAWETSRVYTITGRRPYLSEEWHAKAKGAIGD